MINGKEVFIIMQVDGIAVAATDEATASEVVKDIGKHMKAPIRNERT